MDEFRYTISHVKEGKLRWREMARGHQAREVVTGLEEAGPLRGPRRTLHQSGLHRLYTRELGPVLLVKVKQRSVAEPELTRLLHGKERKAKNSVALRKIYGLKELIYLRRGFRPEPFRRLTQSPKMQGKQEWLALYHSNTGKNTLSQKKGAGTLKAILLC